MFENGSMDIRVALVSCTLSAWYFFTGTEHVSYEKATEVKLH